MFHLIHPQCLDQLQRHRTQAQLHLYRYWAIFFSSMVESTPKRITPVVTTKVAKPWVSPLISWEKSNQGYVSNYVPYSTGSVTPSASSVIQRIVYQSILPSVPSLLPQPLSAQSRTASCQDTNTILPHPWRK